MAFIDFSTILGALSIGFFAKKMSMKKLYQWIFWSALLMIPMALSITPVILRFGYYSSFFLYILSSILIATMMTMISIFVISAVQKKTPNENLGKVMAIIMMVSQCMAPIGQILYGSLFELFNGNLYVPILFVSVLLIGIASMTKRMLRNEEGTV